MVFVLGLARDLALEEVLFTLGSSYINRGSSIVFCWNIMKTKTEWLRP